MPEMSPEQSRLSEELRPIIDQLYSSDPEPNTPWVIYAKMDDSIAIPPKPIESNVVFLGLPEKPSPSPNTSIGNMVASSEVAGSNKFKTGAKEALRFASSSVGRILARQAINMVLPGIGLLDLGDMVSNVANIGGGSLENLDEKAETARQKLGKAATFFAGQKAA